jgi:hypothetical protein
MPPWAAQVGKQLLGSMSGLVFGTGGLGYPSIYTGMPYTFNQQVAGFQPGQLKGMQSLNAAASGPLSQLSGSANQLALDTMGGKYLNPSSNPQLQNYYKAAAQPMVAEYQTATAPSNMAAAQQAGMFNSNAYADKALMDQYSLGNNLQQLAANIYEPAYQFERGNQLQTQQMLPMLQQGSLLPGKTQFGVGAIQQQMQQSQMDANRQNAISGFQFPYQLLSQLGGSIGQATGGASNVISQSPGPSGK